MKRKLKRLFLIAVATLAMTFVAVTPAAADSDADCVANYILSGQIVTQQCQMEINAWQAAGVWPAVLAAMEIIINSWSGPYNWIFG